MANKKVEEKATENKEVEAAEKQKTIDAVEEVLNPVLSHYDVREVGDDVHIFERVVLTEEYAGEKGVKTFKGPNGEKIYYAETLVKKFSQNVVSDGSDS